MEKLTNAYKSELLNALSDLEINYTDFEHQLENTARTYAKHTYNIETENLNITIELEEEVLWSAYDDYEMQDLKVTDLVVSCNDGEIDTNRLSDTELENNLNY